VILVSFSDGTVRAVRQKNPRVVTGAGLVEMLVLSSLTDQKAATWQPPCPFFQLNKDGITAPVVAHAHAKGARIQAWTVNDPAEVRALLDLGVDGIMSDDPDMLASAVAAR
jgi:glycerophosphoryl diester phosphodiesterase